MKKLLYGFIFSLMLFSYADAQIATDQIYGGVYTKAEVDGTIENAVTIDASGFDGNLATTDDTVQKVAQKLDDLDTSAVKVITVDGDTGTTGSTVKLVAGSNVTITRTDDTVEIAASGGASTYTPPTVTVTAGEAITAGNIVSIYDRKLYGSIGLFGYKTKPHPYQAYFIKDTNNATAFSHTGQIDAFGTASVASDKVIACASTATASGTTGTYVGTVNSNDTITWSATNNLYTGSNFDYGTNVRVISYGTTLFAFYVKSGALYYKPGEYVAPTTVNWGTEVACPSPYNSGLASRKLWSCARIYTTLVVFAKANGTSNNMTVTYGTISGSGTTASMTFNSSSNVNTEGQVYGVRVVSNELASGFTGGICTTELCYTDVYRYMIRYRPIKWTYYTAMGFGTPLDVPIGTDVYSTTHSHTACEMTNGGYLLFAGSSLMGGGLFYATGIQKVPTDYNASHVTRLFHLGRPRDETLYIAGTEMAITKLISSQNKVVLLWQKSSTEYAYSVGYVYNAEPTFGIAQSTVSAGASLVVKLLVPNTVMSTSPITGMTVGSTVCFGRTGSWSTYSSSLTDIDSLSKLGTVISTNTLLVSPDIGKSFAD